MKKSIVVAAVVGTMFGTPVAMAASQVVLGKVSFWANGKLVSMQNDLVYNHKAYVPVSSLLQDLHAAGVKASWKSGKLSINTTSSAKASTSGKTSTSTSSTVSASGTVAVTDADYSSISNGNYLGKTISFSGNVFETPQKHGDKLIAQIDITQDQTGDLVDVIVPASDHLTSGEFVTVTGKVVNDQSTSEPTVVASTVKQTTWGDAFFPAVQIFTPQLSSSQNGFTMSLDKVEIAKGQVRLYLSAKIEAGTNVQVDDFADDTLTEGNAQFPQQDTSGLGYPDFQQNIANGTTGQAVLIFNGQVTSGQDLVFSVPVSSDNFNQNWNNFTFNIVIPPTN